MIQGLGQEITEIPAFGHDITEVRAMGELAWQKQSSIPDYLCFTALEAGQFTLTIPAAVTPTYLSYVEWSKDGRTWTHTDNTSEAVTIDVQVASGEKVYWRGSGNVTSTSYSSGRYSFFSSSKNGGGKMSFDVSGNLMSILALDAFSDSMSWDSNTRSLCNLFEYTAIRYAKDMIIPLNYIGYYAAIYMFKGSSIVSAPTMHPTRLGCNALNSTFASCKSLTDVSGIDLSGVTTFEVYSGSGRNCYNTFSNCTALTTAPLLPSIAPVVETYQTMFNNCSSLTHVKCLATDISATNCLQNWLKGVSSTGTFIQASGVTWPRGASGIPTGWVDVEKRSMPSGYKQLLQVTSNGTAYIQLSFGFEETDEVAATFSVDTSQRTDKYIVCPQTWNNKNNRYGMGVHNSGRYTAAFGNRSTSNTMLTPNTYNNGELHNWTYAAATFAVTDKSCSINVTGYTFGGITTNLRLFYGYNSNTKGAISSYKHIKGSTTACDFVAAVRESDNTAGLYDLANDEFMTCNGLTAGEEI